MKGLQTKRQYDGTRAAALPLRASLARRGGVRTPPRAAAAGYVLLKNWKEA